MPPNPFVLAADNPAALLQLLRDADPSAAAALARRQDEHGYSLVHAAASYNHADLLRALVRDYGAPVDLRDEDGETALFAAETVATARLLVEGLGLDPRIRNADGADALERIEADGDWPAVAHYLRGRLAQGGGAGEEATHGNPTGTATAVSGEDSGTAIPPPPGGLSVSVGTMEEAATDGLEVDPEFRRRIEELAAREDFNAPEGQAALRQLVQDAVSEQEGLGEERNV